MDATEQQYLHLLRAALGGTDYSSNRTLSMEARIAAGEKYRLVMNDVADRDIRAAQAQADNQNETRRIDLEYERLQVQKVELVVRAMEATIKNPELGQSIGLLTQKLLGG
jgi:hypothetical protein